MPMTQIEFDALLADPAKEIRGDIDWVEDEATLRRILVDNPARLYGFG